MFYLTVAAVILYSEIGVLILLMLPLIRTTTWAKIFESRVMRIVEAISHIYKYPLVGMAIALIFDAVWEFRKFSAIDQESDLRPFRALQNVHISAFVLFLAVVIRRTMEWKVKEARFMAAKELIDLEMKVLKQIIDELRRELYADRTVIQFRLENLHQTHAELGIALNVLEHLTDRQKRHLKKEAL